MNTESQPKSNEFLDQFRKGFQGFYTLDQQLEWIIFKVGGGAVGSSVDNARRRINDLKLPLTAKQTSYNTFIVELA